MNIIVTMAGLGERFKKAGFNCPKYMIVAKQKTLFEWSMESLVGYNNYVTKYVFVVRSEDKASNFIQETMRKIGSFEIEIVEINKVTDGQATTALLGVEKCSPSESILIFNIDTYIEPFTLKYEDLRGDGSIPCFKAEGDHWSFVKEVDGKVVDVVEKNRISDNCSIGAYYFKTAALYIDCYRNFYKVNNCEYKEKYIAPLYRHMIETGLLVTFSIIDSKKVHVLGTPEELNIFLNK